MSDKRFTGTDRYVATEDLMTAVNAAVTLGRPILIKGEPGTGKTQLAEEIARGLDRPLLQWHVKSTTKAQQGLYEYDAVDRLRDSQLGEDRVHDISNYIKKGKLWEAFESGEQVVLLIDEVDKADIEFPNDLLVELDPTGRVLHGPEDQLGRVLGRLRAPHRQVAHLFGDDREALAGVSGAGGFDRGVERQQVGLEGDLVDGLDDLGRLVRGRLDLLDRFGES